MKKLINFAGILSLFLLFSCSNLIQNTSTSVKVVLPDTGKLSRSIGISYELEDVAEYTVIFEGEEFNETYKRKPGEELIIEEINAGEYKITGYAKNSEDECIGYGVTGIVVLPDQENEVEIVLKKNIISNIAAVIPSRTKESIVIGSDAKLDHSEIVSDIQLEVAYFSGYTTKIGLNEILETGFFFANTYLVYGDGKKVIADRIDYSAKQLVFEVCMYDCDFNEFVKAMENPELMAELLKKQKSLFEFSYNLKLTHIIFPIFDDEDTTISNDEEFPLTDDIVLSEPEPRNDFTFDGWYYYRGDEEVELIEGNTILISNIANYLDADGCIKGKWTLTDLNNVDLQNINANNYSNGFTIKLTDDNFTTSQLHNLNIKLSQLKNTNPNLLINLDMYDCSSITEFKYYNNGEELEVSIENLSCLRSVKLPCNIQSLPLEFLQNCINLQEVYIPRTLQCSYYILKGVYNNCNITVEDGGFYTNVIGGVEYPQMLFAIEDGKIHLYVDCELPKDGIKIIPEGVQYLENSYENIMLDKIIITKDVVSVNADEDIYMCAFNKASIKDIEIRNDDIYEVVTDSGYKVLIQKEGNVLLYDCPAYFASERTIPVNVMRINSYVYNEKSTLSKVIINSNVVSIYPFAFDGFNSTIQVTTDKDWYYYSEGNRLIDPDDIEEILKNSGSEIYDESLLF